MTPVQLWVNGLLQLRRSNHRVVQELRERVDIENYGIDWEGPSPSEEWGGPLGSTDESVVMPETSLPLSLETSEELARTIDPCQYSEFQGVDIYMQTLTFIERAQ